MACHDDEFFWLPGEGPPSIPSGETSHTGGALPCRCKSSDGCKVQEVEACCKTRGWRLSWQNRLAPANPLANPFALLPRDGRYVASKWHWGDARPHPSVALFVALQTLHSIPVGLLPCTGQVKLGLESGPFLHIHNRVFTVYHQHLPKSLVTSGTAFLGGGDLNSRHTIFMRSKPRRNA